MSLFSRYPRVSFFAALGVALGAFVGGVRQLHHDDDLAAQDGRAILGRGWFERYPESATESAHFLLFLAGGLGIHEDGSRYKFSLEMFEFERFGSRLDAKMLADGEKHDVKFKVERCSDLPPFDACLRFEDAFRGPKTYYGFVDDEELQKRLPWVQGEIDLAKSRAR